jgi:hypothetical protein
MGMSRAQRKPNLFVVGAPKCGTTAWMSYLGAHPDICFSEVKEPGYFAMDLPGIRCVSDLNAYELLFRRHEHAKFRAEASAMYLYSAEAAKEIRAYNPDAKILIFLRDQQDFLPSYHHQLLYGFMESIKDLELAWRLSGNRPTETIPKTCLETRLLDYVAVADFKTQVERYLTVFPRDQVHVVYFDDWTTDPRKTYLRILAFLGVPDDGRTEFSRFNEAKSSRFEFLARLILRPPPFLMRVVKLITKILGRDALGLGAKALKLISSPGYTTSISSDFRAEIRRHYEKDNESLRIKLASSASE